MKDRETIDAKEPAKRKHPLLRSWPAVVLMAASCSTYIYPYRYISLENGDTIEIIERGHIGVVGLTSDEEMPILYQLSRNEYRLLFEVPSSQSSASILIAVVPSGGKDLVLVPMHSTNEGGCAEYDLIESSSGSVSAVADGVLNQTDRLLYSLASCEPAQIPESGTIAFRVTDPNGSVLGQEELPFAVKLNGFYEITAGL